MKLRYAALRAKKVQRSCPVLFQRKKIDRIHALNEKRVSWRHGKKTLLSEERGFTKECKLFSNGYCRSMRVFVESFVRHSIRTLARCFSMSTSARER